MVWKTRRQVSAGGVVVRQNTGVWEIALIARSNKSIWCLPKGHVEAGETNERAALREVREETGLRARILGKLPDISYSFSVKDERIRFKKTVYFFLMQRISGSIKDHDFEVDEVGWFTLATAIRKMTYPSERKLVQRARQELKKLDEGHGR